MTTFRRGDIALVIFPNSDLRTGKKRPVLIVDSDDLSTGLPQRIVAMVSSNISYSESNFDIGEKNHLLDF